MSIPSEFNGYVSFFWYFDFNLVTCHCHSGRDKCSLDESDNYVRISDPIAINCALHDVRDKQVEALEKQIQQERVQSQNRVDLLLGRIQELRALEVMP